MKPSVPLTTVMVMLLAAFLWTVDTWARAGGGRSFGSRGSRSYSAPVKPGPSPSSPSPSAGPPSSPQQLASPRSEWISGLIVGGLVGLLAGGVIGHVFDRQERTREGTAQTLGYTPDQGDVVRIEEVSVNPQAVRPGETVNVSMQYMMITPQGSAPVRVREVRQLYYRGQLVGHPVLEIDRVDGTYWSTLPITLPAAAEPGRYEVVVSIELNKTLDRRETHFTVTR